MGVTLVSVSRITAAECKVVFVKDSCSIFSPNGNLIGEIPATGGLYRVHHSKSTDYAGRVKEVLTIDELHRLIGHISHDTARDLVKKGLILGVVIEDSLSTGTCAACKTAKATRKPVQRYREGDRSAAIGDEIHSDVWGPAPVETLGGRRYYVSFTDDNSRWTQIYLMRTKDEVFSHYKGFAAWLKTQHTVVVKTLHSDRGGEYLSTEFSTFLAEQGTACRLTVHDTPEYNGIVERLNRTLVTKIRAMLIDSGLPKFLWGEAAMHACYLKNRTSTRALEGTTPHEAFLGGKPDISNLHPWGCKVFIHNTNRSKLDPQALEGRWVGFDEQSKAHRIYWPSRRSVTVERSVRFMDDNPGIVAVPLEGERVLEEPIEPIELNSTGTAQNASNQLEIGPDSTGNSPEPLPLLPGALANVLGQGFEEIPPAGRGKQIRKPSDYVRRLREGEGSIDGRGSVGNLPKGMPSVADEGAAQVEEVEVAVEERAMAAVMGDAEGLEPTLEEARKRPDWPKWLTAIKSELESLNSNETWTLVERPSGVNVIGSKWVLRIKKNTAGEIDKYKARLVAQVAKLASICLVLAIAACNGWAIESFDFNSAYLNSVLDDNEVVYLEKPPQFASKNPKQYVLRLRKALYGLKQGGRKWYEHLCVALADLGFRCAEADYGVFFVRNGPELTVLAIHVDDCIITGSSTATLSDYKLKIGEKYQMTDLGPVSWLLGIKHAYIDTILTRFNFTDLRPISIPMDPNIPLSKSQCPTALTDIARMKKIPYREAIGSLMYAAVGTRPDIAFAVSTLAQFSENPGWVHWEAVKRVFRYLLGTRDLSLVYGGVQKGLEGFVDADGASQEHRRAITGYVFLIDGGAVSWSSKKQELVTLSTTEAEYVAATHAAKEVMWIRRIIGEVFRTLSEPTTLYSDSQSAIALMQDGQYHACTKHIDIRYHYIRYIVEAGSIRLIYCPTHDMTVDALTKALPSMKVKHFAAALGLSAA
ncbi:hypothetical protein EW026_g1530 [Hermanssonia centrifuga]|uniref:Integrase catalytic domain-containing protein n=1 Tax=Hermanssonia centrifuga TaxID=98765 RepID=A0A4S4KVR5_9APHY|nr:hypothetical protein EW026_g1530 [Hermanssonia centrifuga]